VSAEEGEMGGCELCERDMPLTRHHLIPRSTHKKYAKMGVPPERLLFCAQICRWVTDRHVARSLDPTDAYSENRVHGGSKDGEGC
jgi:hypothetical protein